MSKPSSALIEQIYKMAGVYTDTTATDAELIQRYANMRDEQAFSTLMVRHGLMVWSICQRILHNTQDVEEAFQTTFLALAHKVKRIRGETLVGWLHHVAQQTAAATRRKARSRANLQRVFQDSGSTTRTSSEAKRADVYEELHGEIAKLPEKLRVALVLHYLEGKTQVEIGSILGLEESAVWHRLARGRAILEKRLSQRGLGIAAATLGSLLAESASNAAMPTGLVNKTVKAATAFREGKLTEGLAKFAQEVLKVAPSSTPWWKTGWMITLLSVSVLGVAAGGAAWRKGLFGTNADTPPVVMKEDAPQRTSKETPAPPRLDLYGDPLPRGAVARLGTTRLRPHLGSASVCFTVDGKFLITAGSGGFPRLWNVVTGEMVRRYGESPVPLDIIDISMSRDGKLLVGRNRKDGGVIVWETITCKIKLQLQGNEKIPPSGTCALSPNGDVLTAVLNGRLGLWEVATGRQLWEQNRLDKIHAVAFSPNNKEIASVETKSEIGTGGPDRIILWDASSGTKLRDLGSGSSHVCSVDFSPNGERLLVCSHEVTGNGSLVALLNVATGNELWVRKEKNGDNVRTYSSAKFSPNGKLVAVSGPYVRIWKADTGEELRRCQGCFLWRLGTMAFSPDGKILAMLFPDHQAIRFWNVESGKQLPSTLRSHTSQIESAQFLADGETLVSSGRDHCIRFWNARRGQELHTIARAENRTPICSRGEGMIDLSVSRDGQMLAATFLELCESGLEFHGWLWDTTTGQIIRRLYSEHLTAKHLKEKGLVSRLGDHVPCRVSFSPDGKSLLTDGDGFVGNQAEVCLWELDAVNQDYRKLRGRHPIFCLNGGVLFTTLDSGRVPFQTTFVFWEVATGKKLGQLSIYREFRSRAVARNGRTLAFGRDGEITLYPLRRDAMSSSIRVGKPHPITVPSGHVNVMAFSPDGRMLAFSGSGANAENDPHTVYVYEAASGQERARFSGHTGEVRTLCFAPDSRRLVSGANDTTLLVWDLTGRAKDDGSLRAKHCPEYELQRLCKELGDDNAMLASDAIWKLATAGTAAVSQIAKILQPVAQAPPEVVDQCIADLDSQDFKTRRRATDALSKLGEQCGSALLRALNRNPPADKRQRLESLLERLDKSPQARAELFKLRAVEVLERVGTSDAVQLLKKLAAGAAEAHVTLHAKGALNRLNQSQRRNAPAKVFEQP